MLYNSFWNTWFTRNEIILLSGLTGHQFDTLRKQKVIKTVEKRYSCLSVLIGRLVYEYNCYFGYKTQSKECRDLLEKLNNVLLNDVINIIDKWLIIGRDNDKSTIMIFTFEILEDIINMEKYKKVISKVPSKTMMSFWNVESLTTMYINGEKIIVNKEVTTFKEGYVINLKLLAEKMELLYEKMKNGELEVA